MGLLSSMSLGLSTALSIYETAIESIKIAVLLITASESLARVKVSIKSLALRQTKTAPSLLVHRQ